MEVMVENGVAQNADCDPSPRRRSFTPIHHNTIASGPTIEELLNVKYDALNDSQQTDIATTIRNAILIPNNLNVSDDCLRILCNRRAQDTSLVLDTTAESVAEGEDETSPLPNNCSQDSDGSEAISDQDLRCARELAEMCSGVPIEEAAMRRVLRQVSPLPRGLITSGMPILNGENSGNAVFDRIGESSADGCSGNGGSRGTGGAQLTFNGRIPAPPPPRPDHVIIQIEADTSLGRVSLDAGSSAVAGALDGSKPESAAETEDEGETDKSTAAVEESFEFTNERSPDLFADHDDDNDDGEGDEEEEDLGDDRDEEEYGHCAADVVPEELKGEKGVEQSVAVTSSADRLMQRDNHLLKRLQTAVSGVLPPPSVTNVAITVDVILSRYKEFNGQLPEPKTTKPADNVQVEGEQQERYLLKSVHSPNKAQTVEWPELKNVICHDVCYNLSNAIEQFEHLTVKFRSRFSGSDTASSFVMTDLSSAKKRANRTKALNSNNSPGRRLSHLARRRAIFSCANLQGAKEAAAQAQQAADLSRVAHRQILLPVRRTAGGGGGGAAAKGRTPGKKRKTPGSSAKKRALVATFTSHQQQRREALTRETSKRALFQSPGNKGGGAMEQQQQQPPKPKVTPEVAIRVDKSKRALFSSPKFGRHPTFSGSSGTGATGSAASSSRMELSKLHHNSMINLTMRGSQESLAGKRKRDDFSDEDEENQREEQYNKVLRTDSPRRSSLGADCGGGGSGGGSSANGKSFMRSQSFTAQQLHRQKSSLALPRTSSEMHLGSSGSRGATLALNEAEKKKLLWVVSQTLQRNQVDATNAKFKEYATVMAKVIKRLYLETSARTGASVTDQMNRLANNIAFNVMQNKQELEIYSAEKLRIQAQNRKKLTGYINLQEYEQMKASSVAVSGASAASTARVRRMSSGLFSETSSISLSQCSGITGPDENYNQAAAESSSTVLRENVDTEQRQQRLSSQKSSNLNLVFSGKDQKNVSPFSGGDGSKRKLLVGGALISSSTGPSAIAKGLNVIKAKRQISFDT